MNWIAWIASKHVLLVHLPAAAALMIPLPIFAAQRGGRGIRPWWTTCRYLAWAGLVGSALAVASGFLQGRLHGHSSLGALWGTAEPGVNYLFRIHEVGGFACLVLSAVCLRSLFRARQEHQGIGVVALLLGLLWCATALTTSYAGALLVGHGPAPALFLAPPQGRPAPVPVAAPAPVVRIQPAVDPEATLPVRALDFASLQAMQAEPVKSAAHGNRWIRVWVSPAAAKAYQAGQALPPGTLAVLTSTEDRWGRPGFDPGPLYALEIGADGQPRLSYYWAQVPEARRTETHGAERVYWRDSAPELNACRSCHAQGAAARAQRSRPSVARKAS
jgi:uncharacterized membrane protein